MEEKEELKPLPCAYCHRVPEMGLHNRFTSSLGESCFICLRFKGRLIEVWNGEMTELLELRRKDFKSGWIARDARHGRELHGEGLKELMCEEYISEGEGDE